MSVRSDLLERIASNVHASGVEHIAIVSVMGAYRTGKSFLLDLFLRYLRHQERSVDIGSSTEDRATDLADDADVVGESAQPSTSGKTPSIPSWLLDEGDIILEGSGKVAGGSGFHPNRRGGVS